MSVPRPAPRRQTIDERLAMWVRAYNVVWDELARLGDSTAIRAYAATIAAELVKGVSDADDARTR